jgi:hypothetical protein
MAECTGIIWALLLTKTKKVRRNNGVPVPMSEDMSWKHEFIALWKHLQNKRVWSILGVWRPADILDLVDLHPRFLFVLLRWCIRNIPQPAL